MCGGGIQSSEAVPLGPGSREGLDWEEVQVGRSEAGAAGSQQSADLIVLAPMEPLKAWNWYLTFSTQGSSHKKSVLLAPLENSENSQALVWSWEAVIGRRLEPGSCCLSGQTQDSGCPACSMLVTRPASHHGVTWDTPSGSCMYCVL